MNAYVYRAALLCTTCALKEISRLKISAENLDTGNSDDWPQGSYEDGGGEADSPQSCDHCMEFLKNPLTEVGYGYVQMLLDENAACGRGSAELLDLWAEFYELGRRFKWTAEFWVDETWVADGFDLTDDRALRMLSNDLSYAHGSELQARVVEAPAVEAIRRAQGYKEEASA